MSKLKKVMMLLVANDSLLPPEYKDHPLIGEWQGHRDCHIGGDFVLIYKLDTPTKPEVVVFVRVGTHATVFENWKPSLPRPSPAQRGALAPAGSMPELSRVGRRLRLSRGQVTKPLTSSPCPTPQPPRYSCNGSTASISSRTRPNAAWSAEASALGRRQDLSLLTR